MSSEPRRGLVVAVNNADIGGGEVMALSVATVARDLGVPTTVVGPGSPGGAVEAARSAGLSTVALAAGRGDYVRELRAWDRHHRTGVLWCAGLVPAAATAGHPDRVVQLHQHVPARRRAVAAAAARGARLLLVPSHDLARSVRGSEVLWNWTADIAPEPARGGAGPTVVGFLGRPGPRKGLLVLVSAIARLAQEGPAGVELVVAGEPRFVPDDDRARTRRALDGLGGLVRTTGWLERAEFMRLVDVVVVPSVDPEAFGLVAAEAMAAGRPVVVSDAGALPEVVGPDHPWVAGRGDPDRLAGVLREVLSAPPASRAAAVAAARDRWERCFAPAAGRARLEAVLTRLGLLDGASHG